MEFGFEFFDVFTQGLISRNATSDDDGFGFGILFNGGSDFFKENISDGLIKGSGEIGFSSIVE